MKFMCKKCLLVLAFVMIASTAWGASYPTKPITLLVPMAAGGGSDIMARTIAGLIGELKLLPQPLVVENRPGGSGFVGYTYVANRKADPYIITTTSASFWNTPIAGNAPINYTSFTPVAAFGLDPQMLCTRTDSPFNSLAELVAAAKEKPDTYTVGASSAFSAERICLELLNRDAGIKLKHLAFKSGGEVMTALLGGHVDAAWINPSEGVTLLKANQIKAFGLTHDQRLPNIPDVATFIELGYDDVVYGDLRGIVAPLDIPKEALDVLVDTFEKLTSSQTWKEKYLDPTGVVPRFMAPEEWGKAIVRQNELITDIFNSLGMAKNP